MRHLPHHPRQPFATSFPHVRPAAIDLIERMLTFDPYRRITGTELYLWLRKINIPIWVSDYLLAWELVCYAFQFSHTAVEEALAHPYLEKLHDVSDEPICMDPFSFEFEQHALTEEQMKELIYKEALAFNPQYGF